MKSDDSSRKRTLCNLPWLRPLDNIDGLSSEATCTHRFQSFRASSIPSSSLNLHSSNPRVLTFRQNQNLCEPSLTVFDCGLLFNFWCTNNRNQSALPRERSEERRVGKECTFR